jgi:hypothetical protein
VRRGSDFASDIRGRVSVGRLACTCISGRFAELPSADRVGPRELLAGAHSDASGCVANACGHAAASAPATVYDALPASCVAERDSDHKPERDVPVHAHPVLAAQQVAAAAAATAAAATTAAATSTSARIPIHARRRSIAWHDDSDAALHCADATSPLRAAHTLATDRVCKLALLINCQPPISPSCEL